jgi:hypothetical protein
MAKFNSADYVDVAERIRRFWELHPNGRIVTDLMSLPDEFDRVVFKASVFVGPHDPNNLLGRFDVFGREAEVPDATGWAAEERGTSYNDGANFTSWHENCETSAIGRALANLGFVTKGEARPSRQEMEKVHRASEVPDGGSTPSRLSALRKPEIYQNTSVGPHS